MPSSGSLERRKALADALAGVVGSLVSLWTFYPIEVVKSNQQLGCNAAKTSSLFQGCKTKTLHTACSSFCYFFFYSWIFAKWKRHHHIKRHEIFPATRLVLSAVAAMMNTFITLPLDVLSSKEVTEVEIDTDQGGEQLDQGLEKLKDDEDDESYSEFKDSSTGLFQDGMREGPPTSLTPIASPNLDRYPSFDSLDIVSFVRKYSYAGVLDKYAGLWKGLAPALLLCSNPSIHYTAFDMTKTRILGRRSHKKLSMSEAFFVGLFAKFIATVATYPLIRAKVILMVTSEKSLIATLSRSYREEGVRGLYRGCDWQLLHTVLKSALMMMVRERISESSRRILLGHKPTIEN